MIGIPGYGNIQNQMPAGGWAAAQQGQMDANQQAIQQLANRPGGVGAASGMGQVGYGNIGMNAISPQNSTQDNNAIASAQQGLAPARGGSPTMPNTGMQMYGQQAQMQQAPQRQQAQNLAVQAGGVSGPTASQQVPPSQGGATVGKPPQFQLGQGTQQAGQAAAQDIQSRLQGPQQPQGMSQNQLISRAQGMQTGVF